MITEEDITMYDCYGKPRKITLSWSRLQDFIKCKQRVKLLHEGKRQKFVNARNFLAGNLVDNTMREALTYSAKRDDLGRFVSLDYKEMKDILPEKFNSLISNPEKGKVYSWKGDNIEDQKGIIRKAEKALEKLYPLLIEKLEGRRYIPEFRPKEMPPIGIPGPDGETCYIRLFLAVDLAIQVDAGEDPTNDFGKWALYDLKTTESVEYLENTLPQLVFYDIGFSALFGERPVEHGLLAPLAPEPIRMVDVTDKHRSMVMDWIIRYCHGVWAGEDSMTEDESECFNCSTKLACPKNVLPLTKTDQGTMKISLGGALPF